MHMHSDSEELQARTHHQANCFEAALEVASENADAVVVHGWLRAPDQWVMHAWAELGDTVMDLTESREPIDKAAYYAVMGVTPERTLRYDRLEFFTQSAESGGFGPFDPDFFYTTETEEDPLERRG